MTADPFERQMIRRNLQHSPAMTLKGITILGTLVVVLIYALIDCNII